MSHTVDEQNIPDDSVEVNIQVNGQFNQNEANELKEFIVKNIMGRKTNYYRKLVIFCNERNYKVERKHHTVTIYK